MTTEQTPAALAEEIKRLAGEYAHCYAFVSDNTMPLKHRELHAAIARLEALASAAQGEPVGQEPIDPWRPFALTLEACLNRGEDPSMLMDENSPLRGELRRLIAAPVADWVAPKLPATGKQDLQVPEGWKLVPVEPTSEMFDAACVVDNEAFCGGSSHGASDDDIWAAMVNAAPPAPCPDIKG